MKKISPRVKGIVCILFAAFGFSMMSVFIRLAGDVPTAEKAFFRNIVALAVVGCALWLVLPHGGTTDCTAEIWIDGQMVRGIYLPQAPDEVISLAEYGKEVQLEVKNHRIAFISSDCPDKVCIHNGWLSREGEQAICLPNRVSVTLTDGSTVPVELN